MDWWGCMKPGWKEKPGTSALPWCLPTGARSSTWLTLTALLIPGVSFCYFIKHVRLKIEDGPVWLKHNMPQQQCGKFKSPWDLLTLRCLPSVWVRTSYFRNHNYPGTRLFTVLQPVKLYSPFPPKSLKDSASPLRLQNLSSESVIASWEQKNVKIHIPGLYFQTGLGAAKIFW